MAEKTKTPEEIAAEKRQKAKSLCSAIGHFQLKLRFIDNITPIEDQINSLAKYNDIPTKEEIATSSKVLDSYREEFINQIIDKFFLDYPEMLELLGDKKTDSNALNFAGLGVMSYLFSSNDEETLKRNHKDSVNEYYNTVLPQYLTYLINFIVDNKRWDLTINNETAFSIYADIHNKHNELVNLHSEGNIMMNIHLLIRDVINTLVDKIVQAKDAGIDENTYSNLISDKIINKYIALNGILNTMAQGGISVLQVFIDVTFKEYTITDIYNSISVVESKLSLNEKQEKELEETKKILEALRKKGIGNYSANNSGCLGVILAFIIPLSILAFL